MDHHTKTKGDLAVIKAISDLCEKGFVVFTPLVCEHLPFDIIAYKDCVCYRLQSKYSFEGTVMNRTSWADKNGSHVNMYKPNDFDYYAVYLPDKNVVCYPSITFGGCKITTEIPNSATPFYWYKDFLEFTDSANKRTYREFGIELTKSNKGIPKPLYRKVIRPSKDDLEKLLWSRPMTKLSVEFGVSDKAVAKWADSYGISRPKAGYWLNH
jgi:hypothetical protein